VFERKIWSSRREKNIPAPWRTLRHQSVAALHEKKNLDRDSRFSARTPQGHAGTKRAGSGGENRPFLGLLKVTILAKWGNTDTEASPTII